MTSLRDAWLIGRFEVLRAIRSWQALAIGALYLLVSAGFARGFVRGLQLMEGRLADSLGVPRTQYPGSMLADLAAEQDLRDLLSELLHDATLVDTVLAWPVMAVFHLWIGFALVPYLAATIAAESLSMDLRSRALRFELMRTGRLELVLGRFGGQAAITAGALVLACLGTWSVTMAYMVEQPPIALLAALLWLSIRAWAFSLPFVGLGVAASQWTASPAWARVLAMVGVTGTWAAWGVVGWAEDGDWGPVFDVLATALPQGWLRALWQGGADWIAPCVFLAALGIATTGLGYVRFSRTDL